MQLVTVYTYTEQAKLATMRKVHVCLASGPGGDPADCHQRIGRASRLSYCSYCASAKDLSSACGILSKQYEHGGAECFIPC